MPRPSPPNKKCPKAVGGGVRAISERDFTPSVAPPRPAGKIQPPRDPYLRAIWKVRQVDELTPTQQLALLALWRLLRNGPKQIGAGLLAALIGVSTSGAKNIFSALQQHGYIKSDGKFRDGRQDRATRELTDKLALPKDRSTTKVRSSSSDQRDSALRSRSSDSNRSRSSDIDLGVGHTVGVVSDDTPTAETTDDPTHVGRTVRIVDLLAADADGDLVKSSKGGAA